MGAISEAKDRLVKHREDVRAREEQEEVLRVEAMRGHMLDLWNALAETHPSGLYLTNREIEESMDRRLTDFLYRESGRQLVDLKMVIYSEADGNITQLVLGAVDPSHPLRHERSLIVGLTFAVREGVFSLEANIGRKEVSKDTERQAQSITNNLEKRSELLRYGEPIIRLAQKTYLEAVRTEAGPAHATGGVSGG